MSFPVSNSTPGLPTWTLNPPAHTLAVPLNGERRMLGSSRGGIALPEWPDWSDLGRLPLRLLPQGMQDRRILDARLATLGLALRPIVAADSYLALLAIVRHGQLCSNRATSHAMLLDGLDI